MYVRRPFQWYKVCWFWWENVLDDEERMKLMKNLGIFPEFCVWSTFSLGCMCFGVRGHAIGPRVQVHLGSARWISNSPSLRIRARDNSICCLAFISIIIFHVHTTSFIIFIFFSNWKIHISWNNDPNWLEFFAQWYLSCLLFYDDFSRICARVIFWMA